jgi:hypothetical protein
MKPGRYTGEGCAERFWYVDILIFADRVGNPDVCIQCCPSG